MMVVVASLISYLQSPLAGPFKEAKYLLGSDIKGYLTQTLLNQRLSVSPVATHVI